MKTTFVKNEIELLYLTQILAAKLQPGKTEILNESTTWLLTIHFAPYLQLRVSVHWAKEMETFSVGVDGRRSKQGLHKEKGSKVKVRRIASWEESTT